MFKKIVSLSYWLVPILFVSLGPLAVQAQAYGQE